MPVCKVIGIENNSACFVAISTGGHVIAGNMLAFKVIGIENNSACFVAISTY